MIRWSALAFLLSLITVNIVRSTYLIDSETTTSNFDDESVSAIIGKLIEIEQKVNSIDQKLKDMKNSETINVEKVIAQKDKEYETQRSLGRISEKVDDVCLLQSEMKTELLILSKKFEERFEYRWEIPDAQSKNSAINATVIENLIFSYQDRTEAEIASLGKSVNTIENVVSGLRDSQKKLGLHLESHISNENQKIVGSIENRSFEIENLVQTVQKDVAIFHHDMKDEYFDKKILQSLEINFKSINKTLLENQKNLISNINANSQDLKRSISKNGELTKTIEYNIQASLGKSAILTNLVRELRDSQKIFQPHLESHILNENEKLFKGLENKNNEIKKLLEVAQKQMTIPKHDDIDEYLDKKLLPSLEINFKIINKTLLENQKNLISNLNANSQDFKRSISIYGELSKLFENNIEASLAKSVIKIENVVNELRNSQQKMGLRLESYISNENQQFFKNIENKSNEIKKLFEVSQKDKAILYHDAIVEYFDKKLFPNLENNFKSINKTLLESQKNLTSILNENSQDLNGSISKFGELTKTLEYNMEVSSGKRAIIISTAVYELRDSLHKWKPHLESHISNQSQEISENIENKYKEIKQFFEDSQKEKAILYHDTMNDYFDKKLFPNLEINLKSIHTSLLENRKNLTSKQIELYEGFKENIAKYFDLNNILEKDVKKTLQQLDIRPELNFLNHTILDLNSSMNSITDFLKGDVFESCSAALRSSGVDGVYKLFLPKSGFGPFEAYCSANNLNGSAWTVLQKRFNSSVNFHRDWRAYKHGFGDPNTQHWIGLEKIHALTSRKQQMLYIELTDFSENKTHTMYTPFEIGSEKEGYYLKTVGKYCGDAGDFLGKANVTRKFTTYNVDNDIDSTQNCAISNLGAWWYDNCTWSDLNSRYRKENGIHSKWHGSNYSLKYTFMAIRELCEFGTPLRGVTASGPHPFVGMYIPSIQSIWQNFKSIGSAA